MIQINAVPKNSAVAPDWAEIARIYAQNEISVSGICEKFDICQSTLYRRAREGGWTLRRTMAQDPQSRQPRGFGRQAELVERLYQTLESFLKIIEDRVAMPENFSAADRERDGRTMNSLVKLFGTLTELDNRVRSQNNDGEQAQKAAAQLDTGEVDAARLREGLAERLARLRKHRDTG